MSQAIKVSDAEMSILREAAQLHSRSIAGQAEYWMRMGRAFERNPNIGFSVVEKALKGLIDPDELSEADQEDYFDKIGAAYREPSPKEEAFFAERRRLGLGVGMDEAGNIVSQKPESPSL